MFCNLSAACDPLILHMTGQRRPRAWSILSLHVVLRMSGLHKCLSMTDRAAGENAGGVR